MATLGRRIAGARHEAGLTQDELGQRVGVTDGAVRGWESDRSKPPVNRLRKIAEATNKPMSFFLGDESGVAAQGADLAAEVKLLRERLDAIETGPLAAHGIRITPDHLREIGFTLTPEEIGWLGQYDGAPCDTLEKAVDMVLLWRNWQLRDRLREREAKPPRETPQKEKGK